MLVVVQQRGVLLWGRTDHSLTLRMVLTRLQLALRVLTVIALRVPVGSFELVDTRAMTSQNFFILFRMTIGYRRGVIVGFNGDFDRLVTILGQLLRDLRLIDIFMLC